MICQHNPLKHPLVPEPNDELSYKVEAWQRAGASLSKPLRVDIDGLGPPCKNLIILEVLVYSATPPFSRAASIPKDADAIYRKREKRRPCTV
jgi:hypothetical protein